MPHETRDSLATKKANVNMKVNIGLQQFSTHPHTVSQFPLPAMWLISSNAGQKHRNAVQYMHMHDGRLGGEIGL